MPKGYTFDSNNGPGIGLGSAGSSGSGGTSSGSSGSGNIIQRARDTISSMASNISEVANTNTSLLGDKIREILQNPSTSASQASVYNVLDNSFDMEEYYDLLMDLADYNNTWSAGQAGLNRRFQSAEAAKAMNFEKEQANSAMNFEKYMARQAMSFEEEQAQKQMDYQTRSDQAAMAWSAQEAAKSRDWSERLSNNAHRREVRDLLAAGLNPILAANGGAWTGSGSSGQGYSSSGAMGSGFSGSGHSGRGFAGSGSMGQTDMGVTSAVGSLLSNSMTTARDMAVMKLQTDQQRYNTDMQYAIAKMQAETSIFNNNSNIDANKAIRALDRDADIAKAGISANATRDAAAMSAGAVTSAAYTQAQASRYAADKNYSLNKYRTDTENALERYKWDNPSGNVKHESEHNMTKDPIQYFGDTTANWFVDKAVELGDLLDQLNRKGRKNYSNYGNGTGSGMNW